MTIKQYEKLGYQIKIQRLKTKLIPIFNILVSVVLILMLGIGLVLQGHNLN